ncbi:MAG: sugar nucleotide-binding protein [Verrucomicrobiota bacterium]
MIVILGGSGYVGSAYRKMFDARGIEYINLARSELDYANVDLLVRFLRSEKPEFLINAAGYTGKPNVDACEKDKVNCLFGNAILPGRIAEACAKVGQAWGHVSSGCIFTGSRSDGSGFTEEDDPNFTFRQNNCSFYSGTKALGEEILNGYDNVYLWRLRIPFDNHNGPRNYISKLLRYDKLLDATNSISHLGEFVAATFACWEKKVPFGIYNVTNPGSISARQIIDLVKKYNVSKESFVFFESEADFMREAAVAPRSNCVMDSSKLVSLGIEMTPVEDAVRDCLENWS